MSSIKFYTVTPMAAAAYSSHDNSDSAYGPRYLFDFNRDLPWKAATQTSARHVRFDLGYAIACRAFAMHVPNHTLHNASITEATLEYSDDGVNYTAVVPMPNIQYYNPLWVQDFNTTHTHRYWRLTIPAGSSIAPDVSMIAMCALRELSVYHNIPATEARQFYGEQEYTVGGYLAALNVIGRPVKTFRREYTGLSSTDRDALINAFEDSMGSVRPLFLVEGTNDPLMVKFASPRIEIVQNMPGVYRASVDFAEVPYVKSGELF